MLWALSHIIFAFTKDEGKRQLSPLLLIQNNNFLYCILLKFHVHSKYFRKYAPYNSGILENFDVFLENLQVLSYCEGPYNHHDMFVSWKVFISFI